MPVLIPSYVYTLFASMAIGTLLICASSLCMLNVKYEADLQQLNNIAQTVASKCFELATLTETNNVTSSSKLSIPISVGNQRYWLQLGNDSRQSWVEIGFGTEPTPVGCRALVPLEASASGAYISGVGTANLECYLNNSEVYLVIGEG